MGESAEKAGEVVVVAVTKIQRGARSGYLPLNPKSFVPDVVNLVNNVQVGIWNTSAEIQPLKTQQLPLFWPKLIKIAPDCHDQNVQLLRVSGIQVVVQATKDIQSGDELLLWFDEDILIEMNIPSYLSPVNIRGGNSYMCNICGHSFEAPNNLKVHIALKCDSFPVSVLWGRLASTSPKTTPTHTATTTTNSPSPSHFWPSLLANANSCPPPLVPILVNGNHPNQHLRNYGGVPQLLQPRPHIYPHTRLPVVVVTSSSSSNFSCPIPPTAGVAEPRNNSQNGHCHQSKNNSNKSNSAKARLPTNAPVRIVGQSSNNRRCKNPTVEKAISVSVSDPEAQLESIVSNMGKARNGHMCLYCGKLYSRKYGLKIHIRTHTGYKPLRCKICHRPFGDPSNLNKHIRLHSDGNTPYRCDICHKVLVRKRDLERHVRSRHTNNHPVILPTISLPQGIALDCRTSSINATDTMTLNTS